jgi:hypothetical protein
MGCGATKEAPAEEPAPISNDKMKFRQATVLDLLAAENEENARILLQWAGKVFDQFDADQNGRLVLLARCLHPRPFEALSCCPCAVLTDACTGFQGAGRCAEEAAKDKTHQFAAGQTMCLRTYAVPDVWTA